MASKKVVHRNGTQVTATNTIVGPTGNWLDLFSILMPKEA